MSSRAARRLLAVATLGLAASALTGPASYAAPTDLDATFGTGGRVAIPGDRSAYGYDLARLPDGGYVTVGYVEGSNQDAFAAKVSSAGQVDGAFGFRHLDNAGASDYAAAVAVQPDGRILVAGSTSTNSDGGVWRLLPTGDPDPSFGGGDGFVNVDSGANEQLFDVAVAPDGKIVVVGSTSADGGQITIYRRNADGTPDGSFDGDGAIGVGGQGSDTGYAVAVQADGKVVVAGEEASAANLTVRRLTTAGQPDSSFSGDGVATVPGALPSSYALVLQADGRIVVAGSVFRGPDDIDATVFRLGTDGSLDGTFGGAVGAVVDLGGYEEFDSLAITPTGQVVGTGYTSVGNDAVVARFGANGALDPSFGAGGVHLVVGGNSGWLTGAVVQPDGRILAAGDDGRAIAKPVVYRFLGTPTTGAPVPATPTCDGQAATIVGTAGKDRLIGTKKADVIVALGGNDRVRGLGGNDVVCAGDGNDEIYGGAGKDRLYGEQGKDRLAGGSGKDRLVGGPDRDTTSQRS